MNASTLNEIDALWQKVLKELQTQVETKIFDVFFKDSFIYSISGREIIVAVDSDLAATVLQAQYKDLITQTVDQLTGTNYEVNFVDNAKIKNSTPEDIILDTKPKFFVNSEISPNLTFDNFVVGPSNKEASQASLIVASTPGKLYNPLFLYSPSGLGKTHLLNAVGNYLKQSQPGTKVLYASSQTFFEEYQNSIKNQKDAELFKKYIKEFDVVLVDDIQFFQNKHSTEEFFFNIFEYMKLNNKQLVLTSDRSPNELRDLDPRLQTRFSSGLQISISKPTTEMCQDILKKKIEILKLPIYMFDDDVLFLLADKFKNSIRDLEGGLNRLIFYSNMNRITHIDMDLAVNALQSLIDVGDSKSKVSAQKILNIVSSYYNLSINQITGKIKTAQIVTARHIAIYLIRNMLDVSLKQIGEMFSNRDHSTIMHSIKYVDDMLKENKQYKTVLDELKKRINA